MNEEEGNKGASTTENNQGNGNESKELDYVERADLTAKRLEEATKNASKEREALEKLEARRVLGGRTAQTQPVEKKEVDPAEYARKALANQL